MDSIALVILGVFALALLGGLVRKFRRDPCLKQLHRFHVTFLAADGQAMWGDASVTSQGIELYFDAVHRDEREIAKSSAILYESEISSMIALVRITYGMTPGERSQRQRHSRSVLQPGVGRRALRRLANLGGMVRDAFV